jgi:hypothetical protein
MEFELSNVRYWVEESYAKRLEKLGFKVKKEERPEFPLFYGQYYVEHCELPNSALKLTINTLDELMLFVKEYGQIILHDKSITIYDSEFG